MCVVACGVYVCVCVCHGKQRRLRSTISRQQRAPLPVPHLSVIHSSCCSSCRRRQRRCCCCCCCLRSSSVHLSQIFVGDHRWRPAPKGESRIPVNQGRNECRGSRREEEVVPRGQGQELFQRCQRCAQRRCNHRPYFRQPGSQTQGRRPMRRGSQGIAHIWPRRNSPHLRDDLVMQPMSYSLLAAPTTLCPWRTLMLHSRRKRSPERLPSRPGNHAPRFRPSALCIENAADLFTQGWQEEGGAHRHQGSALRSH